MRQQLNVIRSIFGWYVRLPMQRFCPKWEMGLHLIYIYIDSHSRSMQSRCKFWGGDPVARQKPSIPTLGNDRECGFQIELHKSMNLVYALETGFWPSSRWFQTIFFPFNRSCLGCSAPIRWDLAVWFQSLSQCSWQPDSWVVATRPAHSPVYGSRLKIPTTFVQFLFYT